MSSPIVIACFMDASFSDSSTPSPWHVDAVGGRPPHHPERQDTSGTMGPVAARSSGAGAARQYGQKGTGLAPRHRRWLVRADEEDAGAPSLPRPAASGSIPAATSAGAAPAARLSPLAAPVDLLCHRSGS